MTGSCPRRVTILGVTGSVGSNTADLIAEANEREPGQFQVFAVTAQASVQRLAQQAKRLKAEIAVIADEMHYGALRDALAGTGIRPAAGIMAIQAAAAEPADWVMASIVGTAGLRPTLAALKPGTTVALANKECLVTAGPLFMERTKRSGAVVLPVDSEHSAIFQLLEGRSLDEVKTVTLTASGGPFRLWPLEQMAQATVDQACAHPNWAMGQKISIDSATLMNKGLELIEAHHLFGLEPGRLDAIIHPQSIVHGLVTLRDGQVLAHMSQPHMRMPISYALSYPQRKPATDAVLSLASIGSLTFEGPDLARFPCFGLALDALRAGGAAPTILNAANETAVEAFRSRQLGFLRIADAVSATMNKVTAVKSAWDLADLDTVLALDAEARRSCREIVCRMAAGG